MNGLVFKNSEILKQSLSLKKIFISERRLLNWKEIIVNIANEDKAKYNSDVFFLLHLFSSDSEIVCNCNETAILLTVRKEGPNTGRQFYKCPKPQGNCDFFLWADSPAPSQVGGGGGRENHRNPSTSSFQRSNTSSGTQCNCQEPARLCTVQKAGPNQGRQFYGCSKPRESSCNFFLWASDEATAGGLEESSRFVGSFNSNTSNRGRGRGRGGSNGTNREPKKRKCGICGQEGIKNVQLDFLFFNSMNRGFFPAFFLIEIYSDFFQCSTRC